ncbi:DNA polymerase III subunit delta' [Candidatus Poribacteria bacterium]|nr:DNA polymerase III subunit delta' [Candidatus Poribacteria bacterium]MYG07102.1 DNA polymerase III subunit delta' [Candidatus Poribacteria bacterium]MYK24490.1 DNA polymerase III subunit delta' [Candidatus Poribacteria bacterium]
MPNPIIGHQHIVEQLQHTVASDRIAGAYLFVGPTGVGKETVARYFAQLIFCEKDAQPPTVCGACLACRKVDSGNHPDLQFIRPEGSFLKIGQIRELQKQIIYEPLEASRKVYILTDVDRMNAEAENCLLKTLEEPPASSVLILLTSNIRALLPTTRSRCQILQFHSMQTQELAEILVEKFSVAPEQATALAIAADGAIGKALTQLEKGDALSEEVPEILKETDPLAAFRLAEHFKDNPETLGELVTWYRDLLFLQQGVPSELITHIYSLEELQRIVPQYSRLRIQQAIQTVFNTKSLIENTNTNATLALEVMCLKLLK